MNPDRIAEHTAQEYDNALHLMEVQGGSFVRALAACYYVADTANKATLRDAFAKYFDDYARRFAAIAAARGQK